MTVSDKLNRNSTKHSEFSYLSQSYFRVCVCTQTWRYNEEMRQVQTNILIDKHQTGRMIDKQADIGNKSCDKTLTHH